MSYSNREEQRDASNDTVAEDVGRVQVPLAHYNAERYDELHRWYSYWYQIRCVAKSRVQSVLELGCGTKVFSRYLKENLGVEVRTYDFDPFLKPDIVGDIREIDAKVESKSHDAVCAFQVLEHLPFADLESVAGKIAEIARERVFISLPYNGYFMNCRIQFIKPIWQWRFSRKLSLRRNWKFDGEHYWEIGAKNFPLRRVRACLSKSLVINAEYFCPDYAYHYFYECSPRNELKSFGVA